MWIIISSRHYCTNLVAGMHIQVRITLNWFRSIGFKNASSLQKCEFLRKDGTSKSDV